MDCVACGSAAVTERPERTPSAGFPAAHAAGTFASFARGYRRFRCHDCGNHDCGNHDCGNHDCGKQYNERSGTLLNHAQYPSEVIALVALWRLRHRLTLRDLSEMFLQRGIVFSHEAVREWEAKLAPVLADELRLRRHGRGGAAAGTGTWMRRP
jgi:putative transposase